MTPLGHRLRLLRKNRKITLKAMAEGVGVSSAYLSALEHGRKGTPTWFLVQRIITFFNLIWDEAEEIETLAALSDPKISIDTIKLSYQATYTANILARDLKKLTPEQCEDLTRKIKEYSG